MHDNAPESQGTFTVPAFDLPLSSLLSDASKRVLLRQMKEAAALSQVCPVRSFQDLIAARQYHERHYYPALIARHRARYPVTIRPETLRGVPVEIIEPAPETCAAIRQRVLINLHGGGFVTGARWGGQVESIPIAATGRIKVVSVDYRLAPEHRFPAASEDVAAVYRELLDTYEPQTIGIYGCSAGALLTAQAVAWLQKEGLPRPGAVAMFCAGASYWGEGDSARLAAALGGVPLEQMIEARANPYLRDADANDPLVFPLRSRDVLSRFPPSLLAASMRDVALSSVVHTHGTLVELGVKADLHVWEGLDHAFHSEPALPASRQLYSIASRFFGAHLAK